MHLQELVRLLQPRTFRPFRIHVSDGAHYDIYHTWQCLLSSRTLLLGFPGDNPAVPLTEDWTSIDIVHITRTQVLAPTNEGNGQAPA